MIDLKFGFNFRFIRDKSKDAQAKVAIEKLRALEKAEITKEKEKCQK